MKSLKQTVIDDIIDIEGDYSDNKDDSGGETRWGITKAVARANGYKGDMRDLPRALAFAVYEDRYWKPLQLDTIAELSPKIAAELADTGINQGIGRAAEFLQRCLNVLNKQGLLYPDLKVDGSLGPATLRNLRSFLLTRGRPGELVLFRMLNCLQGAFYVELAEKRQKDETFVFGWFQNRVQ